jgi:hypothetical protein
MTPATESDHEISSEQARSLGKRWVWIILLVQLVVFYIPLPLGMLFYHFYGYNFELSELTKNWWDIPATIFGSVLLVVILGWAFDVYARLVWKRLARAQTGIGKLERGVKRELFALATSHAIGNFFVTPLYFVSSPHRGSAAQGLALWSVCVIPPLAFFLAKLANPRRKKGS